MNFSSRDRHSWYRTRAVRRAARGRLGIAGLLVGLSALALASEQQEETLETRSLAATCAACHGTEGRSQPGSLIPTLAHLPRPEFVARMRAFREDDALAASVMAQIAKGYSDQQVAQLAEYFASLP